MSRPRRSAPDSRRAYRALLRAFLLVDVRGQHYGSATGVKASEAVPPLYWVFAQFLAISALLSALLFARVDTFFFALAHLSLQFVLVTSSLIVELEEAVLDPRDREVIGHRPVPASVYAAARFTNLLAYVALMSVALLIFPLVIGAASVDSGAGWIPAYLLAALLTSLASASLVVLAHTLGARFEGVRALLAWVQILLVMALFYGGQVVLRNADGALELFAAQPPVWATHLPTAYLARWVAAVAAGSWMEASALRTLAVSIGLTSGLGALAWTRLRAVYAAAGGVSSRGPATHASSGALLRGSGPRRARRLGFALALLMLRRDVELRLRALPALSPWLAALGVMLLTDQQGDPFVTDAPSVLLPLALPTFAAGAIPGLLASFRYSRHSDASWLLLCAPLRSHRELRRGVLDAAMLFVVTPMALLTTGLLAYVWRDPMHAIAFGACTWLLLLAAARASLSGALPSLPFTEAPSRGAMSGSVALLAGLVGAAVSVATGVLFFAAGDALRVGAVAGVLGLVALLIGVAIDRAREAT